MLSASPPRWRSLLATALEIVLAVGLATAAIAALQTTAPAVGLGIVYLLAILALAVRRGERPALIAAVLSVLTLNYLFVTPRHQLNIAHSQDEVELVVLLITALVVGRLAGVARQRAAEAEERARVAVAHKREAELLADAAAAILIRDSLPAQLESLGSSVADASGADSVRVALEPASSPEADEDVIALPSRHGRVWLCIRGGDAYDRALIQRLTAPLGGLVDVAVERDEVAARIAEAEAASRADVARTAILHAISHDLRSPITAIITAVGALRSADVTARERGELLSAIDAESARLARLVSDLLDLSRIEAGAVTPQQDWCDLVDVVASAARRFDGEHSIVFDLPRQLPLVRADAVQLERVFANLIENAVKFSGPDSPVRITGGAGPSWVTVRIVDQGPGIPLAERRHIFEPFFRGRRGGAGSGLGLAICRGFVEANAGRIVVQSHVGMGTSFAVSFRVASAPAPRELGEAPSPLGAEP
jgi:two-component system, OmpR family, sensor histidine kinase KdpD